MNNILVCNAEAYEGEYVTTCSTDSNKVFTHSANAEQAYNEAKDKGCDAPVIMYVPKQDESTFIL